MSTARCQPNFGLPMGMDGRQFVLPPCPCLRCKKRAREEKMAQIQAVAASESGICGKSINVQGGQPCGAGTAPMERSTLACARRGSSPGTGTRLRSESGPGIGPGTGMEWGLGPGTRAAPGPETDSRPGSGPGWRPGSGPGWRPGSLQSTGTEMIPGMTPGSYPQPCTPGNSFVQCQENTGEWCASRNSNVGPEMNSHMPKRPSPGMEFGLMPEMTPVEETMPELGPNMTLARAPHSSCTKGQCSGNKGQAAKNPANTCTEAEPSSSIGFGVLTYGRKSSETEGIPRQIEFDGPCSFNFASFAETRNAQGRDTLGLPIHLQGNKGLLNASGRHVCGKHKNCDNLCGINTDCQISCKGKMGRSSIGPNQVATDIHACNNVYINALLTFLMEVLGILVFFAFCTFTFWITLGYYIIQLLIDLKNAGRNVHVAIGIVLALLIISFAITQATKTGSSCYCHAQATSKSLTSTSAGHCKKGGQSLIRNCQAISKPKPNPKLKAASAAAATKARKYTDSQGRKIFDKSRRYAILTEMKQPPAWIIWLRNRVQNFSLG